MAAYASAVTSAMRKAEKIGNNLGIFVGKLDVTNYNQTTVEETDITKHFLPSGVSGYAKGILACLFISSENGYVLGFDKNTGKIKAYYGDYDAVADGALIEVASDTDLGTFDFVAIGFCR